MKKQLFPIFICLVAFSPTPGCKKEKSNTPPVQKTKTDLITKATWKFSSATAGGSDVSTLVQACQKDNIFTFLPNGNGTIDEGTSKCNAGDPSSSPFTWNFASAETVLHVSTPLFTGSSNDFSIVSISETQMVGSQVLPPYGTVTVTFVH